MAAKKVTIAPDMAAPTLVLSSAQAPNAPVANNSPRTLLVVSTGWAADAAPPPPAALTGPGSNTHMTPKVASASLKNGCLAMPPAEPQGCGCADSDELLWTIDSPHRGISFRPALAASLSNLDLQRPPRRIPPPPLISSKQPASLRNLRGPSHRNLNRAFNSPGTIDLPLENPPA